MKDNDLFHALGQAGRVPRTMVSGEWTDEISSALKNAMTAKSSARSAHHSADGQAKKFAEFRGQRVRVADFPDERAADFALAAAKLATEAVFRDASVALNPLSPYAYPDHVMTRPSLTVGVFTFSMGAEPDEAAGEATARLDRVCKAIDTAIVSAAGMPGAIFVVEGLATESVSAQREVMQALHPQRLSMAAVAGVSVFSDDARSLLSVPSAKKETAPLADLPLAIPRVSDAEWRLKALAHEEDCPQAHAMAKLIDGEQLAFFAIPTWKTLEKAMPRIQQFVLAAQNEALEKGGIEARSALAQDSERFDRDIDAIVGNEEEARAASGLARAFAAAAKKALFVLDAARTNTAEQINPAQFAGTIGKNLSTQEQTLGSPLETFLFTTLVGRQIASHLGGVDKLLQIDDGRAVIEKANEPIAASKVPLLFVGAAAFAGGRGGSPLENETWLRQTVLARAKTVFCRAAGREEGVPEKEAQTSRSLAIRFETALLGVWHAATQKAVVGDAQWLTKADMLSVDSTVSSRAKHRLNLENRANLTQGVLSSDEPAANPSRPRA